MDVSGGIGCKDCRAIISILTENGLDIRVHVQSILHNTSTLAISMNGMSGWKTGVKKEGSRSRVTEK